MKKLNSHNCYKNCESKWQDIMISNRSWAITLSNMKRPQRSYIHNVKRDGRRDKPENYMPPYFRTRGKKNLYVIVIHFLYDYRMVMVIWYL